MLNHGSQCHLTMGCLCKMSMSSYELCFFFLAPDSGIAVAATIAATASIQQLRKTPRSKKTGSPTESGDENTRAFICPHASSNSFTIIVRIFIRLPIHEVHYHHDHRQTRCNNGNDVSSSDALLHRESQHLSSFETDILI